MRCSAPMMVKNPAFNDQKSADPYAASEDRVIPVRCGKCEGCLKTNINSWAFRLEQEAKKSQFVHFITLTYSPEFVPLTETNLQTITKRDIQLWLKRLRKKAGDGIKYFIVGEYGSRSYRPHYHGIIFNVIDPEYYHKTWIKNGKPIGNVHVGDTIDNGAIPYTLKYMYKKGLVPAFEEDDRTPEFRMMSKKLGLNYFSDQIVKYHLTDFKNRQTVLLKSGIKIGMPRYFREKLIEEYSIDRTELLPDEEQETYLTDNDPNTSLKNRVNGIKARQKRFERKRNQDDRKKI